MRDAYRIVDPFLKTLEKMDKTIAAFISGAGSLGSGLVTNALAQQNAREQREWQEKMWLKQTAYNDPSAMAMRMRKAGLNPFTMTGAEPAGSAGTGASAETLPINNPFDSAVSTLRTFAEIDNINANTGKTETEIEKIIKEVEYIDVLVEKGLIDVDTAKIYRDKLEPRLDAELEKIIADTGKAEAETGKAEAETITEQFKQNYYLSEAQYKDALTTTENQLRDDREELLQAQEDDYRSQIQRRIEQTAIDYALLKVQQQVGKSQFFLNQAMTHNERRDFGEKIRTFDARQTALDIGNQLGMTDVALKEYADAVNDAWKTVMSGNPFTDPMEFFDALGTVYADTLRNLSGNVNTFVPLDPSKMPTRNTRKIGYGANN